jgi:branched-subunit amino acid transport protein
MLILALAHSSMLSWLKRLLLLVLLESLELPPSVQ